MQEEEARGCHAATLKVKDDDESSALLIYKPLSTLSTATKKVGGVGGHKSESRKKRAPTLPPKEALNWRRPHMAKIQRIFLKINLKVLSKQRRQCSHYQIHGMYTQDKTRNMRVEFLKQINSTTHLTFQETEKQTCVCWQLFRVPWLHSKYTNPNATQTRREERGEEKKARIY